MRYNKDTERGISLSEVATQCRNAIQHLPKPNPSPVVWSPKQLTYVTNPQLTDTAAWLTDIAV